MQAWFLSDLHLRDVNERSSQILLRFLHSMIKRERPITHLFLLGDIFDVWVGSHDFFIQKWEPILTALATLQKSGVRIIYSEGNHDLHLGSFWRKTLNAEVHTQPNLILINDKIVRFEHGDFINPEDYSYLRLRKFLRSPFVKFLVFSLPGEWWFEFGNWWSLKSRKKTKVMRQEVIEIIRKRIHAYARKCRKDESFDYLITGHVHIRDRFEFKTEDGRSVVSINLGSWYDKPVVFGLSENGEYIVNLDD